MGSNHCLPHPTLSVVSGKIRRLVEPHYRTLSHKACLALGLVCPEGNGFTFEVALCLVRSAYPIQPPSSHSSTSSEVCMLSRASKFTPVLLKSALISSRLVTQKGHQEGLLRHDQASKTPIICTSNLVPIAQEAQVKRES